MKRFGSIYIATNDVTGGQYVGQTCKKVYMRAYAHKISSQKPKFKFHYAIAEYGFEQFSFDEVFVAFDKAALDQAEQYYIDALKPVYNMTRGGSGQARKPSAEVCEKRREAAKERWANSEWKEKTVASIRLAAAVGKFTLSGKRVASLGTGPKARWAGHTKKPKIKKDVGASIKVSWTSPEVRVKRLLGQAMFFANKNNIPYTLLWRAG